MRRSLVLLAALGASLAAAPLAAQGGTSALKGHDANAPVDFDADRFEVQDRADRAVLSGNVKVRQGSLSLDAARINIAYTNTNAIAVDRIDASGGVTVRSPSE
ncbi:LptA/OstA family protein, partial [Acinetobacter baumannii]|uniref:LptA/OstA family protein n=1 Tax=Acinetobacter baumannii TaxID=470 RepID=UPI0035231587